MVVNLEKEHVNLLIQLVESGPIHAADLGEPLQRERLIREGLATKIIVDGERNFIAATELGSGYYCRRVVGADRLEDAIQKRKQQSTTTH